MVDIRTITTSVDQQETITKDNVPVKVTVVIWYSVTDPIKSVIEVVDVGGAVVQVALTSMRNVIGRHTLDDVLKEQERLGTDMRKVIDTATEPWGVKVTRVEMRNVEIPESMQRAMHKRPKHYVKSAPVSSKPKRNSKRRLNYAKQRA